MTLSPPIALAAPSLGSPEMQRALAEAANGPDDLRRYVHRTRMIHQLHYFEVMAIHEARKAAAAQARATESSSPATKVAAQEQ